MLFKSILFSQAAELINSARDKIIQPSDRIQLAADLNPRSIPWDESKLNWSDKKSFIISLYKASRKNFYISIFFQVVGSIFAFSVPFLVHAFITRIEAGNFSNEILLELSMIALSFGVLGAGNGIAIQHYFYQTLKFNQIATNVVNKKIFSHALRLSAKSKQKYQVGDIVNYMSSDSDAIADTCITTIDLCNAVLICIGCSLSLFYYLGWSALVAVGIMLLLIPVTSYLSKSFMVLEDEMMLYRDKRITLMTQLLNAIRVVKYFVWEKSILHEVGEIRSKEVLSRFKLAKAEIIWGLIFTSINSIVLFAALLTHTLRGLPIDMALIFSCIAIFGLMEGQFGGLSKFISRYINIIVSADRITKFVQSETLDTSVDGNTGKAFELKDLSFNYNDKKSIFNNLNFSLEKGQSMAVVGPIGAGKSTLLNLLLGEIKAQQGLFLQGFDENNKAYVSQDAFIINSTLLENITFGQKNINQSSIDEVLRITSLDFDLKNWPAGLNTEIGEKGVNLSGGQRQRVSLARAHLSGAEFLLLDDPLSAVDPNTEKHLCDHLIFGAWKDKTRVVVTHRLASLNSFDKILFLDQDQYFFGSYQEIFERSETFRNFLRTYENNLEIEKQSKIETQAKASTQSSQPSTENSRITQDEDRAIGAVENTVYLNYLKALGGKMPRQNKVLMILFVGAVSTVLAALLQKLWLSQSKSAIDLTALQIILIYGLFGVLTMLITYLNSKFWAIRGIEAGKAYHDKMLSAILAAPIRFFDSTPIGRILQRFSRDIESVDIHLQWSFDHTIHSAIYILVSFILIITVVPLVLIFMLPIFILYYITQQKYRRAAREVKRLDSLARSPRYAHFKEVLNGLGVIRAFGQKPWAMEEFYNKLTYSTEMFHTHYMVNRWFSTRLPLIGAAISGATGLVVVFSSYHGYIAAGTAGLATIYALDFWKHLNWGVRIFSDLESRMTSVERLQFYCDLPTEPNTIGEMADLNSSWPRGGDLQFKNVNLRYANHLPLVLKNVSFDIKSGMRVGLIGRTGSGKSTIFQSVYRFVDIESGQILFDGVSVQKIPLKILRKNLSVIPQDPSLFMGTLRSNIDRYGKATDEQIWQVLEKVSLAGYVKKLPNQLSYMVAENGANLSQGQRQLICLARALLMEVKIIFLDEATASVDVETDALVQNVIKNSLDGITLVTIAHRLSTLDGYDMIIELSNGEVISKN